MKKVMVYAYTQLNLGDDLFLKILFERYPNTHFILFTPKKYKTTFKYKNVRFISTDNIIVKGINFIARKVNKNYTVNKIFSKSCHASVYIGGSIFQQRKDWRHGIKRRKNLLNKNQPFYVLGANFGPFDDEKFYEEYRKLISKYEDICFRDSYSYNLFKDLENVRMASDIVFSLNNQQRNVITASNKSVIISVIKPSYRSYLSEYDDLYYSKIKDLSIEFIEKGYRVTLMSFCKHEGDEAAIQEIFSIIPNKYKGNINRFYYVGNIEESLDIIAESDVVIATRFHAMILGWLYNKPVVPIAYNKKMIDVMKDVKFKGLYADFNNLSKLEPSEVYMNLKMNLVDINNQVENSKEHFKELDKLLLG